MALDAYRSKRNFKATPEPEGKQPKKGAKAGSLRFVIQLHDATRKHYDLRLELDGAMKSWALPKGPSLDPLDRRLAVEVEDHPMEYNDFEGIIPRGHYGAGVVMIWDEGSYAARAIDFPAKSEQDALRRGYAKGHITFILTGEKLKGEFALVRLAKGDGKQWLLVKKHDRHVDRGDVTHLDRSVRSGRTLGEIAALSQKEGKVWDARAQADERKLSPTKMLNDSPPPKVARPARAAAKAQAKTKAGKTADPSERKELAPRFRKKATREAIPRMGKLEKWVPAALAKTKILSKRQHLFDGYRVQIFIDAENEVQIKSKNHLPLTKRFADLSTVLQTLRGPLRLDALIVPLDASGAPRPRGRAAGQAALRYAAYLYDLLHADGYDLSGCPLRERMAALMQLRLDRDEVRVVPLSESFTGADDSLLRDPDAPYGSTATIAKAQGGAAPPPQRSSKSEALPGSQHRVIGRSGQTRTKPQLALTNRSKIFWPAERITKGQLIDYYQSVAPIMIPHLQDRPQSLHRQPNGVTSEGFFQKEISGLVPGWMQTATIASGRSGQSVTYALCQTEADLLFLANVGCIEINPWLSRVSMINQPDYVVFDIDPGAVPFNAVIDVAKLLRRLLEDLGAKPFCKTSGSRGLHIYVPVTQVELFDESRHFAQQICEEVHRRLSATTSLERDPSRRSKLIYLDYLQNRIGQTMAAVYSVRPRPHATVSTPLRWTEVKHGLDTTRFTIETLHPRLDKWGDLWDGMLSAAVPLPLLQKGLDRLLQKSGKADKAKKR